MPVLNEHSNLPPPIQTMGLISHGVLWSISGHFSVISRAYRWVFSARNRMSMARNFWIICLCANLFLLLELGFDSLLWTNLVQTASFRGCCHAHSHSRGLMSGKEYFVATYVQGQEDDFIPRKSPFLKCSVWIKFCGFCNFEFSFIDGPNGNSIQNCQLKN